MPIEIEVDIRPAVPPWMNGALLADAKRVLDTQEEGDLMGHPWRFEQLCRATGRLRIGDETYDIDGGANRIRRQSIRREAEAPWSRLAGLPVPERSRLSGTSPTRRATTARTPTTRATSSTATVRWSRPASSEAPWLRTLTPKGEDVVVRARDRGRPDGDASTARPRCRPSW